MTNLKKLLEKQVLIAVSLCAICCALPVFGFILGTATLAFVAKYLEWAAIVMLGVFAVTFGYLYLKRKKVNACGVDCECKERSVVSKGDH